MDAPQPPVIHTEAEDDDSLLDQLTEVLSKPLPGTEAQAAENSAGRDDQGEAAVREAAEAADKDADPVSTTGAAGADWMQREYEPSMPTRSIAGTLLPSVNATNRSASSNTRNASLKG